MATPRTVWQVPRNDVAAAAAFYESRGHISADEMRTLLMLQDDAAELRAVAVDWDVRKPAIAKAF
jgi:hypothetical protein